MGLISQVGVVIAYDCRFESARVAAGPVYLAEVDARPLAVEHDQFAADRLRVLATGYRSNRGRKVLTIVRAVPDIYQRRVDLGIERGGQGHLRQGLGAPEVVDTLLGSVGVLGGRAGIADTAEGGEVKVRGQAREYEKLRLSNWADV